MADTSYDAIQRDDAPKTAGDPGVPALVVRSDAGGAPVDTDGDYHALQADAVGRLRIVGPDDLVSTNNSTTTPLGVSGNFTGTGDDCLGYASVSVIVDSSHDSAADGMTFEWSADNTNWDYTHTFEYTAANGGRIFQLGVTARYFRVNFTNGGTGQTTFRVQTILHREAVHETIHRMGDDVNPDRSAGVTLSALLAQAGGTGDFVAVAASASGKLQVAAEVEGAAATDAAVSGNPVLAGGRANANEPSAVDDGDAVPLWLDQYGRLVVVSGHPSPVAPVYVNATASGDTTVLSAPGASLSLYIRRISIINGGSAIVNVQLQEDATTVNRGPGDLAADGGGIMMDFGGNGWKLAANTGLDVNLGAAGDVHVTVIDHYIAA